MSHASFPSSNLNVLRIKHFPENFNFENFKRIFSDLGVVDIKRENSSLYLFFIESSKAEKAKSLLHRIKILNKILSVEFVNNFESKTSKIHVQKNLNLNSTSNAPYSPSPFSKFSSNLPPPPLPPSPSPFLSPPPPPPPLLSQIRSPLPPALPPPPIPPPPTPLTLPSSSSSSSSSPFPSSLSSPSSLLPPSHHSIPSNIPSQSQSQRKILPLLNRNDFDPIQPSLEIHYPFPPHLKYKYPFPDSNILENIKNALVAVPKFYNQVLHLMNKMNLPPPFCPPKFDVPLCSWQKVTEKDKINLKSGFKSKRSPKSKGKWNQNQMQTNSFPAIEEEEEEEKDEKKESVKKRKRRMEKEKEEERIENKIEKGKEEEEEEKEEEEEEDEEEEMEKNEESDSNQNQSQSQSQSQSQKIQMKKRKRNQKLLDLENFGIKKINLEPKSELKKFVIKKHIPVINIQIRNLSKSKSKDQEADEKSKFQKRNISETDKIEYNTMESNQVNFQNFLSIDELEKGKMSVKEREILPIFKNYCSGVSSKVLYIKNLSKNVILEDLKHIFGSFFSSIEEMNEKNSIKLLQEGRMRGQAFVTFSSVERAKMALESAHGFVLKGKPLVIQFGKSR